MYKFKRASPVLLFKMYRVAKIMFILHRKIREKIYTVVFFHGIMYHLFLSSGFLYHFVSVRPYPVIFHTLTLKYIRGGPLGPNYNISFFLPPFF